MGGGELKSASDGKATIRRRHEGGIFKIRVSKCKIKVLLRPHMKQMVADDGDRMTMDDEKALVEGQG